MGYLIAALVSALLLTLFILLTMREARRGVRVMGVLRTRADQELLHATEVIRHVNIALLTRHVVTSFTHTLAHEVVQVVLAAVRVLERFLVRSMHLLQTRRESVKTLHAEHHLSEVLARLKRPKKREEDEYGTEPVE